MSSYQRRKKEIEELQKRLERAKLFERMFKNYIKSIHNDHKLEIAKIETWFLKNSKRYQSELSYLLKNELKGGD